MSTVPGTGVVLRIRPQRKGLSVTKTGAAAEKSEGRRFRGGRPDFTPLSLPLFRSVCENGALPAHSPHRDADERRREGQGARAAGGGATPAGMLASSHAAWAKACARCPVGSAILRRARRRAGRAGARKASKRVPLSWPLLVVTGNELFDRAGPLFSLVLFHLSG